MPRLFLPALMTVCIAWLPDASAQPTGSSWLGGRPAATIDLTRAEGVDLVGAEWRTAPARIVEVDSPSLGPDLKPSGPTTRTYDLAPQVRTPEFQKAEWTTIPPPQPQDRFGNGRASFVWFLLDITLPKRVGGTNVLGTQVAFETVVDDYAEIWVDGRLTNEVFGQSGGALIKGWNAANRVVLTRDAQPGQQFKIAILAMNGPLSAPPANFVWFRSATIDFYPRGDRSAGFDLVVDRVDNDIEWVIDSDDPIRRVASGFSFTEGPVWTQGVDPEPGYLLFSDPNENTIYRLNVDGELSEFRTKSGYTGLDIGRYRQPGSNGLARDHQGRLTICEHGNRRVTRIERNGIVTVLADRFQGYRLNSPNDLIYRSDDALFFTDPPFGLPGFHDDPERELDFSGVFCLKDGTLRTICRDLAGPNGIAFSPDEKFLYVGNWDPQHKTVTRYEIGPDGEVLGQSLFFDMTGAAGEDAIDGIKVDRKGNVFVSGPGGLWVIAADGRHLGTIHPPEHPHNLAFGGDDGRTLFMTCQTGVYTLRTRFPGATRADADLPK